MTPKPPPLPASHPFPNPTVAKWPMRLEPYVGRKVLLGLTTYHYLCGVVESVDGVEARVRVAGRLVMVPVAQIATIAEADPHLAEYFK